ncbi:MAG: alpha/beta fold hydrolase [Desulfobacterales bacterium]|nr:alpha/beta fold hydrolase [Desulfobacterales bacterium]
MLHGNPTWSFYYRSLVKGLAPARRCIVPDHMGCGLSDRPGTGVYGFHLEDRVNDLQHLMDHLALEEKVSLIVHDWGGMIGLAWALQNFENIRRIVILNTSGFFPPAAKGLPLRLRLIRHLRFFAIPAVLFGNVFARAALYMAPRKRLAPEVKAALLAPYNTMHNRLATLKFVQDIPVTPADPSYAMVKAVDESLHKLREIPMLFCWGKHDFVFDLDYYREWQRRFPDTPAHLLENAGHYILEDEPEKVLELVRNFFNKT